MGDEPNGPGRRTIRRAVTQRLADPCAWPSPSSSAGIACRAGRRRRSSASSTPLLPPGRSTSSASPPATTGRRRHRSDRRSPSATCRCPGPCSTRRGTRRDGPLASGPAGDRTGRCRARDGSRRSPQGGAPLVVTIHDLAFRADPAMFTRHGLRFFRRGTELARRHADLVLVPSEATAAECTAAGFAPDRIRVVPWGQDRPAVGADAVAAARRRRELPDRYVLFVGTLEPRKNLARLVEAWRRAAAARGRRSCSPAPTAGATPRRCRTAAGSSLSASSNPTSATRSTRARPSSPTRACARALAYRSSRRWRRARRCSRRAGRRQPRSPATPPYSSIRRRSTPSPTVWPPCSTTRPPLAFSARGGGSGPLGSPGRPRPRRRWRPTAS